MTDFDDCITAAVQAAMEHQGCERVGGEDDSDAFGPQCAVHGIEAVFEDGAEYGVVQGEWWSTEDLCPILDARIAAAMMKAVSDE